MGKFYRVLADPKAVNRWHLKAPVTACGIEIDPRNFTSGTFYTGETSLDLQLRRLGQPVDFNFCDFDMLVVKREINSNLERNFGDAIQRIPVRIQNFQEEFEILNVLNVVDCIDEVKSEYLKWEPQDGRPEKIGAYRMMTKLVIDPEKAKGHSIFRLDGWKIAVIVSDEIKKYLENRSVSGIVFQQVT
ncbi:MAG: hypothetical protein HUJ18_05045 [Marinobacter sp.]|nr:hypothetical protein [Marinobacter sp.]